MTTAIVCDSRIRHVQVYARGAQVTRRVTATALPGGEVELQVGGITPLAVPGSFRVELEGERQVVALRSSLVVPAAPAGPGDALERVRLLEQELRRLEEDLARLAQRRAALLAVSPSAGLDGRDRRLDPARRVADALAVSSLTGGLAVELEERLRGLEREREQAEKRLEAARVDAAQASTRERAGEGHPTRQVLVRLGAGAPGALELDLTYVVGAARWWPAYTARLFFEDGGVRPPRPAEPGEPPRGVRADWAMTAFVAQASGEDWPDVALALSTADLVQDARLPELPSLRLGRVQPPSRRGYRAAPPGLDAMFASYEAAMARMPPVPQPAPVRRSRRDTLVNAVAGSTTIAPATRPSSAPMDEEDSINRLEDLPDYASMAPPAPPPRPQAAFGGGGPPVPGGPPPAAPPMGAPMAKSMMARSAPAPARESAARAEITSAQMFSLASAQAIEPDDAWLDFDALSLAGGDEGGGRGRLRRAETPGGPNPQASIHQIERAAAPQYSVDPLTARGQFDHRWDAQARAEVPSDARPHRLFVTAAAAAARLRLLCIPRETPEVYRDVQLDNPTGAPLLAGPVDVFIDGALLHTAPVNATDRGGVIVLGLGVEERVRVARNVRVDESSAGLLGGSTLIDHDVTIELRSSLGRAVTVEVIDRAPVSDDDDVEVTLAGRPTPEKYNQAERGRPIRGGVRWKVPLEPGGKATVTMNYRIKLPAKNELQGGNRRE